MSRANCPECGGSGWARYSSETLDGRWEEAFRLCSCNFEAASGPAPVGPECNERTREKTYDDNGSA